jgi:hypothetical protein
MMQNFAPIFRAKYNMVFAIKGYIVITFYFPL